MKIRRRLPDLSSLVYVPRSSINFANVTKALTVTVQQDNGLEDDGAEYRDIKLYDLSLGGLIGLPRHYFFSKVGGTFLDHTIKPQRSPNAYPNRVTPRDDAQAVFLGQITAILNDPKPRQALVIAPTGCHAKGAKILMFDGTIKAVEDVCVNDRLMGPDSCSRTVKRLHRGRDKMAWIQPTKGDSFIVNEGHVLRLVKSNDNGKSNYPSFANVSVIQWRNFNKTQKHVYKLLRTGVDFPDKTTQAIDPYIFGLWLGDGHSATSSITTEDHIIACLWEAEARRRGLRIRVEKLPNNNAYTYHMVGDGFVNSFVKDLRNIQVFRDKHIPLSYRTSSRQQRLQLLAGLVDTDGHLSKGCLEISQVRKELSDDILYVARSLGFAAYQSEKIINNKVYYRVGISGDISEIPIRLPHKKPAKRLQKKNVLVTGFRVYQMEEDDYYGFELDGDHLYLTADFTVHHNSGKTAMSIGAAAEAGVYPIMIGVNTNSLKEQWLGSSDVRRKEGFRYFMGDAWTAKNVGVVQQDRCDFRGKKVIIGMMPSLVRRAYPRELYEYIAAMFIDEVDVCAAPVLSDFLRILKPHTLIGMTATEKAGPAKKIIRAHLGPPAIVSKQKMKEPKAFILRINREQELYLAERPPYINQLARMEWRQDLLATLVYKRGIERGRQIVMLSDRVSQLQNIKKRLILMGMDPEIFGLFVGEYESDNFRVFVKAEKPNGDVYSPRILDLFKSRKVARTFAENWLKARGLTEVSIRVERERVTPTEEEYDYIKSTETVSVIGATYGKFARGINIPRLDMGVELSPRSDLRQAVGRVLRDLPGKRTPEWYALYDKLYHIECLQIPGRKEPIDQKIYYPELIKLEKARRKSYAHHHAKIIGIGNVEILYN